LAKTDNQVLRESTDSGTNRIFAIPTPTLAASSAGSRRDGNAIAPKTISGSDFLRSAFVRALPKQFRRPAHRLQGAECIAMSIPAGA
jgi:hypothetical protein